MGRHKEEKTTLWKKRKKSSFPDQPKKCGLLLRIDRAAARERGYTCEIVLVREKTVGPRQHRECTTARREIPAGGGHVIRNPSGKLRRGVTDPSPATASVHVARLRFVPAECGAACQVSLFHGVTLPTRFPQVSPRHRNLALFASETPGGQSRPPAQPCLARTGTAVLERISVRVGTQPQNLSGATRRHLHFRRVRLGSASRPPSGRARREPRTRPRLH
jgi:hypothetical protein